MVSLARGCCDEVMRLRQTGELHEAHLAENTKHNYANVFPSSELVCLPVITHKNLLTIGADFLPIRLQGETDRCSSDKRHCNI